MKSCLVSFTFGEQQISIVYLSNTPAVVIEKRILQNTL
jgi:hypothetical protein